MTQKQKSFVKSYIYSLTTIIAFFSIITGSLWIYQEIHIYKKELGKIREEYTQNKKSDVKKEVEKLTAYIEFNKSLALKRLKETVKSRTYEAYNIASNIYINNKSKSKKIIIKIMHDALFAASWDNGKGYYFVEDLNGNEIINRNNPDLEGKNLLKLKDKMNSFIMDKIYEAINNEKREGFCRYYWNKPDEPGVYVPKISFVKYFKPLKIVIGTGKYLNDEESNIKHEILQNIKNISIDGEKNIFLGTLKGEILIRPSESIKLLNATDKNRKPLINNLIAKAKKGGGFHTSVTTLKNSGATFKNINYIQKIPEWEWFVGSCFNMASIESEILKKQKNLNSQIKNKIYLVVFSLSVTILIAYFIAHFFSLRVRHNLDIFNNFFKNAADRDIYLDAENTYFSEFNLLALSANKMISERVKVKKKLEASQLRFKNTISKTNLSMMITDSSGGILYLNRQFTLLFGYSSNDVSNIDDLIKKISSDEENEILLKKSWGRITSKKASSFIKIEGSTWHIKNREEKTLILDCFYSHIGNGEGLSVFIDVTDKQKAEEDKQKLEVQLVQAQKMEAIGLMAGGVAHDLNNILSGIIGYPELILMQLPEDSPIRSSVNAIFDSGKRAALIVADLLTIARGIKNKKSTFNLNAIVTEYLNSPEMNSVKLNHPGVEINFIQENSLLNINCSKIHIKKCIMNLLINSAEAIKGKGSITISTENKYVDKKSADNLHIQRGEYVLFTVEDDGQGISENDLKRIFEPFYTKKIMGKSGTGLGLAVVWNTIMDHDGGIKVSSDDRGTKFKLYFPATRENVEAKSEEINLNELKGNCETVLIIDDEPVQLDIAGMYLETLNYKTIKVSSGEEAVKYLKENSADILLLDMIMDPGINGRETYEQIIAIHPDQKAIIASGYSESEEIKKVMQLGANLYIKKPYLLKQLGASLKKALDS